jgi:PAS domain S-box-containing protein
MLKWLRGKSKAKSFELISEQIDQVILLTDQEGYIQYATQSIKRYLGYHPLEIKGNHISDFIDQEELPLVSDLIVMCQKTGASKQNYWFKNREGNSLKFLMSLKSLPQESKVLCILSDVKTGWRSSEYTHFNKNRYQFLLNNMTDCVIMINEDGIVTHANGIKELLGYNDNDIIGSTVFTPVHPEDRQSTLDVFSEFMKKGELATSRLDYRLMNTEGEYIWVEANFRVLRDLQTGEYQILNNLRDVTERKNMEKELRELNKTKDQLFSIIAHDLKSPMSTLAGFAYYLKKEYHNESEDEILKNIHYIHESANQLNELVTNLLNWSRAQFQKISVNPETIELNKMINKILSYYKENLRKKNIEVDIDLNGDERVIGDANMVEAIFRNVISNAIKFSHPQTTIKIGAQQLENGYYTISVKDDGIGISEEVKDHLLDNTSFLSTKGTQNEKGTGLGLKITTEFIKKNDGKLWFERNKEQGTTVFMKLQSAN